MDWYFREFATFSSQPETHLQLNNAVIARSGAVQVGDRLYTDMCMARDTGALAILTLTG